MEINNSECDVLGRENYVECEVRVVHHESSRQKIRIIVVHHESSRQKIRVVHHESSIMIRFY